MPAFILTGGFGDVVQLKFYDMFKVAFLEAGSVLYELCCSEEQEHRGGLSVTSESD